MQRLSKTNSDSEIYSVEFLSEQFERNILEPFRPFLIQSFSGGNGVWIVDIYITVDAMKNVLEVFSSKIMYLHFEEIRVLSSVGDKNNPTKILIKIK